MTTRKKHPTRTELTEARDACAYYLHTRGVQGTHIEMYRCLEKLLNTHESKTAAAERTVVKAAVSTDWAGDLTKLICAVDRLIVARSRARRATKPGGDK